MLDTTEIGALLEILKGDPINEDAKKVLSKKLRTMENLLHGDTPASFEQALWILAYRRNELMVRKNRDYGKHNVSKFGLFGILVRASDKLERLITLTKAGREGQNEESMADTLADLANYGTIGQMLRHDYWMLPYEDELKV